MRNFDEPRVNPMHPYDWLWEPLEDEVSFILKSMFGGKAAYLDGKMYLCFMAKKESWRGVLVCTDHHHQNSLMKEFPSLSSHPVVFKWLYLPETSDDFELTAARLVTLVQRRDVRIGVEGTPKKKKSVGARKPKN